MALDIREGDFLILDGVEYPILFCEVWESEHGSTPSMVRMCRKTASTKRPPAVVGAVRGDAVTRLAEIKCMPLDPIGQKDIAVRNLPRAPYEMKKTIVNGGDTFYQVYVEKVRK